MSSTPTLPALRPGDRVAVVAPAGPAPPARLTLGLERLAERYRVVAADNLFDRTGYLAGGDDRRTEALNRALADPDIRAVFCARGGYGCPRILEGLDTTLRADPKPICGFSDITALLHWARAQGVVAIHGPVVTQLGELPPVDLEHLFALLEDPAYAPTLSGVALPGAAGVAEGPLTGGNLALLGALAGTAWAPSLEGGLLVLEEVGEQPYRIDRVLTTLLQQPAGRSAGGLAGVAVGALTACAPGEAGGPSALEVIAERLGRPGRPLVSALPFGHGGRNVALPLGVVARLDAGRGTLCWAGGVVG